MRGLLDDATHMAADKQTEAVRTSLILLALALALGAVSAAFITTNLVGSLRRLLRGTALVQQGALDT